MSRERKETKSPTYTKTNSKWIKEFTQQQGPKKLLEEKLLLVGSGWDFLDNTEAQAKKSNIQDEKEPTEWQKVLANHIPDSGFISRIYKE